MTTTAQPPLGAAPIVSPGDLPIAGEPELPDIMPPVKQRRGIAGFAYRYPAIAIGGTMLALLILMAICAPLLGTTDPTALAPSKRTRPPSTDYWFGSDMMGRDIYSRVLYGARVSLIVGFSVAIIASIATSRTIGSQSASSIAASRPPCSAASFRPTGFR